MLESGPLEFVPDWFSKPSDSLLSLMIRRELSIETVARAVDGGMETLRGLLTGARAIDPPLARSLSSIVGGSPTFWLRRQANYEQALNRALERAHGEFEDWLKHVPPPNGRSRRVRSFEDKAAEVRARLAFFGVSNLRTWNIRYGQMRGETQFRTSNSFESIDGDVSLWLRQGELEAALTSTAPWSPKKLTARISDIMKLSKVRQPQRFLPKLREIGAEVGVAFVVVRPPKGCKASGASRLISSDKAMVLLSFRHLSDDHFWFTVMHELAHLLLHDAKSFVDLDDAEEDDREREANEFASSCIVPSARWEEFVDLRPDRNSVLRFSVSLGVAPGLIVGQLQHRELIGRDKLNYLKRRWTWEQVEEAISSL